MRMGNEFLDASILPGASEVAHLVDSIGDVRFATSLLQILNDACGAEQCGVLGLASGRPTGIVSSSLDNNRTAYQCSKSYIQGQYWSRDSMLDEAQRIVGNDEIKVYRTEVGHMPDGDLRMRYERLHVCDRLRACGRAGRQFVVLSTFRSDSQGSFSREAIDRFGQLAKLLVSIARKHIALTSEHPGLSHALTSLVEITACIETADEDLPRRETEVCARILYGMSTAGIALDLGISEETVITYRKRAYARIGIGTSRELLLWYLRVWSTMHFAVIDASDLPDAKMARC